MAIQRLQRPPQSVTLADGALTLYEVELSAAPSRAWRAAFLRPPAALTDDPTTPELGRLGLDGPRITFRTIPARLHAWLRRIDRWIAYANSVVDEVIRGACGRCAKPLRDVLGPVVADRDGRSYHFDCWTRLMDEQRAEAARDSSPRPRPARQGRKRSQPPSADRPQTRRHSLDR